MKKQIFTIFCFIFFQETINAQFTLEALNPNHLRLKTNGIDRMAITNGGNFSFGHTAPAGQFHFQRNSAGILPVFGAFSTVGIFENNTDALMYIVTPTTATGSLNFGDTDDLNEGQIQYNHSTDEMSLTANSVKRLFIKSNGKIGIGRDTPDFNLEIKGTSDEGFAVTRFGGDSPGIFGRGAGGTESIPTATQLDHTLSIFGARGHDGTGFTASRARIETKATQNWTASANGTKMRFLTTSNGSTTSSERMVIDNDGDVGINRTTPQAKLDVNGDIILGVKSHEPLFVNSDIIALDRDGKSIIRIIGTNTTSLSGVAGGVDGMMLYLYNYDSVNFTIKHNSATAANENKIWTGNGSDIVFNSRGGAILVYDGVNLKWRVLSYND